MRHEGLKPKVPGHCCLYASLASSDCLQGAIYGLSASGASTPKSVIPAVLGKRSCRYVTEGGGRIGFHPVQFSNFITHPPVSTSSHPLRYVRSNGSLFATQNERTSLTAVMPSPCRNLRMARVDLDGPLRKSLSRKVESLMKSLYVRGKDIFRPAGHQRFGHREMLLDSFAYALLRNNY